MKRTLLIVVALSLGFLSGCIKKEVVTPNITVITDVLPTDWQYSNSSRTYYVSINMPEIDRYANSNYGVIVSFSSGNEVYEFVPEVYNGYAYSFTHQPGLVTLEVQGANGTTVSPPNYTIRVKIVLIVSQ
jgi:hypothetical protein